MGFGNQVKYLLYRNFLLKRRNLKQTIYEVVSVLYFVAILAVIKTTAIKTTVYKATDDASIPTFHVFPSGSQSNVTSFPIKLPKEIGYVVMPGSSSQATDEVIKKVSNITKNASIKFRNYSDVAALENAHKAAPKNLTLGLVIKIDANKKYVDYTIKVPYSSVPSTKSEKRRSKQNAQCRHMDHRFLSLGSCPVNSYYSSAYATLQSIVDASIIEVLLNTSGYLPPTTKIQMMPQAEFTSDLTYITTIVSIYMVMAFSPYIMFLLTYVVTEKELKIKEAMKIMGLSTFAFWFTWFITYAILITFGVIFVVIISKVATLFGDSDYFIIFIIFFLYGLSIEALAFVLTPLFNKGRTAGSAGSLSTIVLSTLGLLHIYLKTSNAVKWLTGFLSPVALSLALTPALDYREGLTWSNINTKGDFPASNGIILLVLDIILYMLLAIYLDSLFPGEYGQRRTPLFCFKPSFWRSVSNQTKRAPSLFRGMSSVREDEPQADVEEVPESMRENLAISIRKLEKVFKAKKEELRALDGVSLDVYEGQITALLGHNGAGKSTLIAALTGMLPASGGSAYVYGNSIRISEDMDKIRQMIGLCPQQNIIYEKLTPREHLKVFAGIKGIPVDEIDNAVEKTLKEIDLYDKSDSLSETLSGGQKRKLCVGIAMIGNPKVIFLDEPTSGMDPSSRRYIWNLLQGKKSDRVIFLTTHFMDEADILADYKAVLSKGKLRCAGSSLYLKSRFGVGYHLSMVTDESCDPLAVTNLVKSQVPGAVMSRHHVKELSYRLPLKSVDNFPDLFAALESNNDDVEEACSASKIGVANYGVSMTTLEEVFLKLDDSSNSDTNKGYEDDESEQSLVVDDGVKDPHLTTQDVRVNMVEFGSDQKLSWKYVLWLQLTALLEVRFWTTIRNPMKIIFQVIIPPIFAIVGLVLMRQSASAADANVVKNLELSPSLYLAQNASVSSKLTEILFQNKTSIADILSATDASRLKYSIVQDIGKMKSLHDLGYEVTAVSSVSGKATYVIRYNDSSLYSIPVGLNTMSNIELRVAMKKAGMTYKGRLNPIVANTKPFKSLKIPWTYDADAFNAILLLGLTFALLPYGFSIEVVKNRQEGLRHQLRVSGVNRLIYWLHFAVGDLFLYIFPTLAIFILIAAFDIKAFNNPTALGCLFLLLLLYNPVSLLFGYVFSFIFNKWETLQNVMATVLIFVSIGPYIGISLTDMLSGEIEAPITVSIMHVAFSIVFPPYSVMGGMYYIARVWRVEATLSQNNDVKIPASKYFKASLSNGYLVTIIILILQLFIVSYFLGVLDSWFAGGVKLFPFSLCGSKKAKRASRVDSADEELDKDMNVDVKSEIIKITHICEEGLQADKSVVVQGLKKSFGKKKVVDNVHFDVDHGEILGLLGPNGAGKTTTMNVMTADYTSSAGEVYLNGFSTTTKLSDALFNLGYCPQADTLWELATLKEHLKCFALIKGIARGKVEDIINHYMDALRVNEHANTKAKDLSGGTKRKLCFLISVCGSPNVVLMDEPSTGMDPASKRFLWNIISKSISGDHGAVLTTHSMEEADALCTRVAILVKGKLRCIGTTQELKSNYGGGYSLEIKSVIDETIALDERIARIQEFVKTLFPNAVESELFGARLNYKVPKGDVGKLSEIFKKLEQGKRDLGIEEYSFSQATLEQVFLGFARMQDEDVKDDDDENVQPPQGTVDA